jgi:hypothetical protein
LAQEWLSSGLTSRSYVTAAAGNVPGSQISNAPATRPRLFMERNIVKTENPGGLKPVLQNIEF